MATDTEQTGTSETAKPIYLRLALSDFTVSETIRGSYQLGDRRFPVEPEAMAFINAKWKPAWDSDKLILNGEEIEPTDIQFSPAKEREDTELSFANHSVFAVRLTEDTFAALRRAVEREDIATATFIGSAEHHPMHDGALRVNFGSLSLEHRKKVEPPIKPAIRWLPDWRTDHYLVAILFVLVLILFSVGR
jgi:hypothetical protein